jgi:broad specificity phosphatase PhoE
MTRLLLVRHGETEWNATRKIQGHTDIALSELGERQCARLRDRLAAGELSYGLPMAAPLAVRHAIGAAPATGLQIDAVVASDLRRAWHTAEILATPWGLAVERTGALREMNWGDFQGYTSAYLRDQWPEAFASWVRDQMNERPPGGESLREVAGRARAGVQAILEAHPESTVLVVAHAGPLRAGLCHLLKLPATAHWQFRLDNASLTVVDTYPEGAIVSLLNDTSHLRGMK